MLDQVKVDYYGTHTPINQLAQVSAPEAQLILISPWDPTVLKEIEKAIQAADLGFNPISDGKVIRVPVPPMTEERRREVVKHLNKVLEEHRTAVRNVRRDGNDALKKLAKEKKIGEDEEKRALRRGPEDDRRGDPPHGRSCPQKRSGSHAGVSGANYPRTSAVDFPPVPDRNRQNHQFLIPNLTENPVVADAIPPELAEL